MTDNIVVKEEFLSEKEQKLCDLFLDEYNKDYDPERACLRLGVSHESLNKAILFFFNSKYVQRRIAENVVLDKPDNQNNIDKAFRYVVGKLRNIADTGSNKDRLEACKQIALLYGLNKPVDIRTNTGLTNVIMTPSVASDAEWEEQAEVTIAENKKGMDE